VKQIYLNALPVLLDDLHTSRIKSCSYADIYLLAVFLLQMYPNKTRLQISPQSQVYASPIYSKQCKGPSSPMTLLFYYIFGKISAFYNFSATILQLLLDFLQ